MYAVVKGVTQVYTEIGAALAERGSRRVQGSLYVCENEDMANLFFGNTSLKRAGLVPKICKRYTCILY